MRIIVGDVNYGPNELRGLAAHAVQLRSTALDSGLMEWAVVLTHIVGVLNTVANQLEEPR